ncbi:hypothetical protein ElyMa_002089400 [Elysia marginata]|uniref:Uncharacterized protein n=1 Tax=Elysia marginata TaxID=1093978 RepID=A0AAV4FD43_9GAST|nr:hypothetical protein ElyMa_002089400 [Elysia marginata]
MDQLSQSLALGHVRTENCDVETHDQLFPPHRDCLSPSLLPRVSQILRLDEQRRDLVGGSDWLQVQGRREATEARPFGKTRSGWRPMLADFTSDCAFNF